MNMALVRALAAFVPVCVLFGGSVVLLFRVKTAWCLLQVVGAGGLVVVTLLTFAKRFVCCLGWAEDLSIVPVHYVNLLSAVVGATLFPLGYLVDALARRDVRG